MTPAEIERVFDW